MKFNSSALIVCAIFLTGCVAAPTQIQLGQKDDESAKAIGRINDLASMRKAGDYAGAIRALSASLNAFKGDSHAHPRVLHELADIYSNNLFDLEKAVEFDGLLLTTSVSDAPLGTGFLPKSMAANQKVVSDSDYYNEYVAIKSAELVGKAKERKARNEQLLQGTSASLQSNFSVSQLKQHTADVTDDFRVTSKNSRQYNALFSRLIRGEYELMARGQKINPLGCKPIVDGSFLLKDVNYEEISFLQLADYLSSCHAAQGDIRHLEYALDILYKPYQNLSAAYRWKYNKLINTSISRLIDANFKAGRFDEVLYYANLNKSRMLLEERLVFAGGASGSARVSDLVVDDGIPRSASGLPDKAWFKAKLAATPQFLDFYVGGTYVADGGSANTRALGRAGRSVMPLTSRNSSRARANEPVEVFKDDAVFITHVSNGRATAVKLVGAELVTLRSELEKSYAAISETKKANASPVLQKIKTRLQLPEQLTVSPDKWVSTHPLDFHLQARSVRAVNFFTSGATGKLNRLSVAGFFNPTLDLAGADAEADVIQALLPQASLMRREAARKGALANASGANVIHLSMHGNFNEADPTLSKLVFAGATNDDRTGDPNALYATEMAQVPALRNRDLVFAAACQTGLQAADRTNSSELTGILRPLSANRNKNLILSLWNVSDRATAEFVKVFYQRLAATQDVKDAFHHAQDQLRAKYPHPYYWAAFYLAQAS